ncbi:hypothetical protein RQP53_20645 [Paucibacter sp. APW11]|uniref:Uncharacterized protein n=1 Tax=Roseateles aquae TaxID=3077235 RepID=A0ABU3PGS1_9BURK|nr:hypothetical protein [Paucibacter sp. APW11]MDT9001698.1 hypothetical protein [Paucibacter sp. APW11]
MIKRHWVPGIAFVILLSGCGGGSGGGGTGQPDLVQPPPEATFRFGAGYGIEQSQRLANIVVSQTGHLINYGQFAVDLAHRFARAGGSLSVTARCAFTGTIALQLDDRDSNGYASPGDVISATLDQCGVPILERKVSGKVRLEVLSADKSVDQAVKARLTVADELQVSWMEDMPIGAFDLTATLKGSLTAEWSETAVGSQLRVLSSETDNWRTTAVRDARPVTEVLSKIDVIKRVRYDLASFETTAVFLLDTGALGGVIKVSTPHAFTGNLNAPAKQFGMQAGLADYLLDIEPAPDFSVVYARAKLTKRTTQSVVDTSLVAVEELALVSDVRTGLWSPLFGTDGESVRVLLPWQSVLIESNVDRASAQRGGGAGQFEYTKADALFQRPVAARPDLSQAGASFPLQFGRAVADNSPSLQFRFVDTSGSLSRRLPSWNVAATAERQGAAYAIRPLETLRQGRDYQLEASVDGMTWGQPIQVKDAKGNAVWTSGTGFLAQFHTPSLMKVDVSMSPALIVDGQKPSRLQTSVEVKSGTTVATHRWEQLSGPTVLINDVNIAEPLVSYPDAASQVVKPVVLQHTVTDTQGHQEKTRLNLLVGAVSGQGALFVWDQGYDGASRAGDAVLGIGSVLVDADGSVVSRIGDADPLLQSPVFSVAAPSGTMLQLGTYDNAVRSLKPGPQASLWTSLFCYGDDEASTNAFTVLDIGRDSDGRVTRLAIDFTQRCVGGHRDFLRGSYRFNSTIPVTSSP